MIPYLILYKETLKVVLLLHEKQLVFYIYNLRTTVKHEYVLGIKYQLQWWYQIPHRNTALMGNSQEILYTRLL
jgi:hypothetical protein